MGFFKNASQPCVASPCGVIAEKSSSPWCCVDGGALSLKWQFHCNVRKCVLVHYPPATTWRCDPCACGLQSLPPPPEQLMKYGWLEFCRCSVKSRIGVILHTRPRLWSSDKVLITLLNTKVWKTRSSVELPLVLIGLGVPPKSNWSRRHRRALVLAAKPGFKILLWLFIASVVSTSSVFLSW